MNFDYMTIYWVVVLLVLTVAVGIALRVRYIHKHGEVTKKRASKVFKNYGKLRGWKVIDNVILGEGDRAVTVDHLVVAPFGILVCCDLYQHGKFYGELNEREWILAKGEESEEVKTRILSPYYTAIAGVEQLRTMLAKAKIYSTSVEVIVPKTQKQSTFITGSLEYLFNLKELKRELTRVKYDKNNNTDINRIVALINENTQKQSK